MKHHKNLLCGAAALLVLAVFAAGALGALLGGAGIYRRLIQRDRVTFDNRAVFQYLATRVRQAPGEIRAGAFGDGDALVIPQVIENEIYLTRVYCHDGYLMELFSAEEGQFSPEDGEKLAPLQAMDLELERGLLKVMLTSQQGTVHSLFLHSKGEGAAP